ncbi:hypothetical protein FW781_07495 (plasmid) [Chryseobacterium panacisoli]|uniref:DUF7033 domain-containing protein n=1 Tax=Chryseobacterium panacisoli TaxID=1807141 RepID=A0A5D8ZZU2_9FLAO|nr:polysaccharide deacetylase family protein [Chryseobacterium panacisoli]TZF99763.1 hypothetical protein FW781_07495 [Chryseobacterium panacisoli]
MRTENAILYTIKFLLKIAFGYVVSPALESLSEDNVTIRVEGIKIKFKLCSQDKLVNLIDGKAHMKHIPSYDNYYNIPVVDEDVNDLYEYNNGYIQVNYDIITLSFILLSCYDEWISEIRDEFDRFRYKDSLVYKYNLINIPVVDEYALLLRKILKNEVQSFAPSVRSTIIIPTHDIDDLYRFDGFFTSVKTLVGEAIREKRPLQICSSILNMLKTIVSKKEDQYLKGVEQLYKDSKKYDLKSVFFFMTAKPSQFDKGQTIDNNVLKLMSKIVDADMLLGIHPGFNTFRDITIMNDEIDRLRNTSGRDIIFARQHYLRFDRRVTFENLEKCGIKVDYTMGFAEHEGFKCGTAHEFYPYNFEKDQPYNILEKPLIVMDATLRHYQKYSTNKAFEVLENLLKITKRVEGDFIILWHNDRIFRDPKWYKEVYIRFISKYNAKQ